MEETDAALVARVRAGDGRAADRLLERYFRACRAIALAVTRNEADADDACQEGFIAAIERIDSCRSRPIRRLAVPDRPQPARNLVRHHAVRAAEPLELNELAGEESTAAELERSELRNRIIPALAELSEAQREVVLLHDLEGWTHQQIAGRLELPAGTVRSHLHHAPSKGGNGQAVLARYPATREAVGHAGNAHRVVVAASGIVHHLDRRRAAGKRPIPKLSGTVVSPAARRAVRQERAGVIASPVDP
jgi:RNA polymerase sigma-70 factor, ECF subfamily